ncbi:MAG: hypothetical protein V2J10_12720 [Wenzhouxiangella sp.]|jgi:hypothetical protein|nr:hypothetical protein [Wenzhouxiangella sp.]
MTRILLLILLGCFSGVSFAGTVGTGFSYQGNLSENSNPANGPYDFEFRLFSDANGTTQVGPVVSVDSLTVEEGFFEVTLDFGDVFSGEALWLELAVRNAGQGSFVALDPLQPISATPMAQFALGANTGPTKQDIYTVTEDSLGDLGPGGAAGLALACDDDSDIALSVSCEVENQDFPFVSITQQSVKNPAGEASFGLCSWYTPPEATGDNPEITMSLECLRVD